MKRAGGLLSVVLAVTLCYVMTPAKAVVETSENTYQAEREDASTTVEWLSDSLNPKDPGVRLESYAAVGRGGRAAVVANLSQGPETDQFSFEVHFNRSAVLFLNKGRHVRPTAVVEYEENNQTKYLTIKDFTVTSAPLNRERWTYDLIQKVGKPLNVKRIGVGGREHSSLKKPTHPMDISIYRFRVDRYGIPPKRIYNTDVKVFRRDGDSFLQRIDGTPAD